MSDYVILSKFGFIPCDQDDEPSETSNEEGTILRQLRCACEIAPNTTLKDIFDGLDRDPCLRGLISLYSWNSWIKNFHEYALLPISEEDENANEYEEKLISLVISYRIDIGKNGVQQHSCLSGVGSTGTLYSVSCTPTNQLAHLPVILQQAEVFIDQKLTGKYDYTYSLLEVLDAIYFDIGFYGGPEDNDALREELKTAVEEIKSRIKVDTVNPA